MSNLPSLVQNPHLIKIIFARVFSKISELDAAISAQEGFWFIKVHRFTKDDLLADPKFSEIYSLLGQVDDLVSKWNIEMNGEKDLIDFYHSNRLQVEERLGLIRKNILMRRATVLESILQAIESLISRVAQLLPALARPLLARFGILLPPEQERRLEVEDKMNEFLKKKGLI